MDCWAGLEKGMRLGWVGCPDADNFWGRIDMEEYQHYDNPLNGDLHEVVPGQFVAFRGPHDLGGGQYLDDDRGCRKFSPSFYAGVLTDLGVTTVVRLNEAEYDARAFEEHGLRLVDLPFPDCTAPPPAVVAAFLAAVDRAGGAVAVHCRAGLGRTGTLIALCMMRSHGFSAREAMGWLRIMRPGSVIGEQQPFLCALQAEGPSDAGLQPPPASAVGGCGVCCEVAAAQAAAEVAGGMERCGLARAAASLARLWG
jgi:cell division cycle 14